MTALSATPAAPLLQASGITVRFGARTVVDDATLTLAGGELVALVGPNGAGKTTLLRALAGLLDCDGNRRLGDAAWNDLDLNARARRLAYLPQGHVFHWPLAAAEVVALGRHPHADPFGRRIPADAAAVARAMAATDTAKFATRSVATLSGGERARVALARAMATEAPVLLADEPTASLDPRHQLLVMDLLRRTALAGHAVLAVTHDLALAARFAHRVLVMQDGRLVADGPPGIALSAPQMAATFGVAIETVRLGDDDVPLVLRPL